MPTVRIRDDEHGNPRYVRLPYLAWSYAVPAGMAEHWNQSSGGYSNVELMQEYDGPFRGFNHGARFQRDGSEWITLIRNANTEQWAIEVELATNAPGIIVPLPPWRAWQLAVERDPPGTEVREVAAEEDLSYPQRKALFGDLPLPKKPEPQFSIPAEFLDYLRRAVAAKSSRDLLLQFANTPSSSYREVERFEREGKRWVRLIAPLGWVVDLELTDGAGAEVRPLPEAEARRVALDPTPPSMPPFPRP